MRKDQLEQAIQKTTKMLARKGIPVTQRGAGAFCQWNKKGEVVRINIPMIPDNPTEEFMNALQGFVDHECAHALYTNSLVYEAAMKASPLWKSNRAAFSMFCNVVEDVRIEQAIPKEFPGAEHNLNGVRKHLIDTIWAVEFPQLKARIAMGDTDAIPILRGNAIIPFLRGLAGQRICQEFVDDMDLAKEFDVLMKAVPDLQKRLTSLSDAAASVKLAEDIMTACAPPPPPPSQQPQQHQDPDEEADDFSPPQDGDDGDDGDDQPLGDAEDAEDETGPDGDDEGQDEDDAPGDDGDDGDDAEDGDDADDADDAEDGDDGEAGDSDDEDEGDGAKDDGDDGEENGGGDSGKTLPTLKEAMKKLSPAQRKVIFNYNTKRLTIEQISEKLNMSETEVEYNLRTGRRRLSRIMLGGK